MLGDALNKSYSHRKSGSPRKIMNNGTMVNWSNHKINLQQKQTKGEIEANINNKNAQKNFLENRYANNSEITLNKADRGVEIKLPVNKKLMFIRKNHFFKNNSMMKSRFTSEQSEKAHQGRPELKSPASQYKSPKNYDPKSELKAKIIRAILSSNQTIQRQQAYKKQYQKQLQDKKARKYQYKYRMNKNSESFRPYKQVASYLQKLQKFTCSPHNQKQIQNSPIYNSTNTFEKYSPIQNKIKIRNRFIQQQGKNHKRLINRNKNHSVFKESDIDGKSNFLEDLPLVHKKGKKKIELDEIKPWVIEDIDVSFNMRFSN